MKKSKKKFFGDIFIFLVYSEAVEVPENFEDGKKVQFIFSVYSMFFLMITGASEEAEETAENASTDRTP